MCAIDPEVLWYHPAHLSPRSRAVSLSERPRRATPAGSTHNFSCCSSVWFPLTPAKKLIITRHSWRQSSPTLHYWWWWLLPNSFVSWSQWWRWWLRWRWGWWWCLCWCWCPGWRRWPESARSRSATTSRTTSSWPAPAPARRATATPSSASTWSTTSGLWARRWEQTLTESHWVSFIIKTFYCFCSSLKYMIFHITYYTLEAINIYVREIFFMRKIKNSFDSWQSFQQSPVLCSLLSTTPLIPDMVWHLSQ